MRALITPAWTTRRFASNFDDVFTEMDRLFDGVQSNLNPASVYDERSFAPACEITESEGHYMMSMDLPGLKKEEINIQMEGQRLTVSGERRRQSSTDKKEKLQRFEKSYGFFKRSFELPQAVSSEKVEARFENGVLEIYLPKEESAKPKNIEIQTGGAGIFEKLLGSKKTQQE